jgi:hypothetical protein
MVQWFDYAFVDSQPAALIFRGRFMQTHTLQRTDNLIVCQYHIPENLSIT